MSAPTDHLLRSLPLVRMAELTIESVEQANALAKALDDPRTAVAQEALPPLIRAAEWFLGAGGVWTSADWLTFTRTERIAAATAGQRLDAARALMHGKAARGGFEAAEVSGVLDGGAEEEHLLLHELLRQEHGR